jgi:FKBP-type peptidyl-prolyl cis-trans isomerase FkpA
MRLRTCVALLVLLPASVFAQAPPAAGPGVPQTDEEKTLYAVGLVMARSLRQFDMSPAEVEFVRRAIADALAGKPAVELDDWGPKIQALVSERGARLVTREKEAAAAYLAKAAAAAGAVKTESGIVYTETTAGTGASPTAADRVKVHYRGTLIDGTEFDSSYKRGQPTTFPVNGVIAGWTEALQLMKEGAKYQLFIPPNLAYADRGPLANRLLIFDVELVKVEAGQAGAAPK